MGDTLTITTPSANTVKPRTAIFDVTAAPVPEASTTASFGLMPALGINGMAVAARRKKLSA